MSTSRERINTGIVMTIEQRVAVKMNELKCHISTQLNLTNINSKLQNNIYIWGFLGGSVVKNPPANAGDMGWIPDLGRSHIMEQLSPCARITEPVLQSWGAAITEPMCGSLLKPTHLEFLLCNKRSYGNVKPMHCTQRVAPAHRDQRKTPPSNEDSAQPK